MRYFENNRILGRQTLRDVRSDGIFRPSIAGRAFQPLRFTHTVAVTVEIVPV